MSVRKHPKDPGKWILDYYPQGRKGKRERMVFEGSEGDARACEAELRRQHMTTPPINPKINDVVADWLDWYKVNRLPNTHEDVKHKLKHLQPFFGNTQFSHLTPRLIEMYKSRRVDEGAGKNTINKELSYFSSLIKYAVKHSMANPLPFKVERFDKVRIPKPTIPPPEVLEAIINHVVPRHKTMVLLLYDTGLRLSEARFLKAEDVFLQRGLIRIIGKGDKERLIPITTGRLREALRSALSAVVSGYLFINKRTGRPYKDLRAPLEKAMKAAGVDIGLYPHLLRHSFGTYGVASGIHMKALQNMMGHSTITTTEIYTHLVSSHLESEAAKFDDYISRFKKPQVLKKKKKSK